MKLQFLCLFAATVFLQAPLVAKIYDCFTFFNELELLQIRFEELYESVDYFVLVEATETFTGLPKPLYFLENKQLFEKYIDKVIHIIVDDFPMATDDLGGDRWIREAFQRNAILRGLTTCNREDTILISDVDEIPNKYAIGEIKQIFLIEHTVHPMNRNIYSLEMRFFLFHLNWESAYPWIGGSKAAPYWIVKRKSPWAIKTLHMEDKDLASIANAGWHFHSMGGGDRLSEKLEAIYLYDDQSFLDPMIIKQLSSELNNLPVEKNDRVWPNPKEISKNFDFFIEWTVTILGGEMVVIDGSYPNAVVSNFDFFNSLGWIKK